MVRPKEKQMKNVLIILSALFFWNCNTIQKKQPNKNQDAAQSEQIEDLIGKKKRAELEVSPYVEWFASNYNSYKLDKKAITALKEPLQNYEITIFMGTWCSDSQEQTPIFYKILDAVEYDSEKVTLIALSEFKDTPEGFEKGLSITHVPTFIFKKNGKEVNRIVEVPVISLEKDILSIISGEPYQHTYAIF